MEAHSSDPEICGLGCEVLSKVLAFANRNCNNTLNTDKMTHDIILFEEEYRTQAGREWVIELVTETMRAHIENAYMCEAGCRALSNITLNNGKI